MKYKLGRAASGIVMLVLTFFPAAAYAAEATEQPTVPFSQYQAVMYLSFACELLFVCSLIVLLVVSMRYRLAKVRVCDSVSCKNHPINAINPAKVVKAKKLKRHEFDRAQFGVTAWEQEASAFEEFSFFSDMETPQEIAEATSSQRPVSRPQQQAQAPLQHQMASQIRQQPQAVSRSIPQQQIPSQSTPQSLTANYGISYATQPAQQAMQPMDLTLDMVQGVLQRLDQRDALLQATLLQHTGVTGQFPVVMTNTGQFSAIAGQAGQPQMAVIGVPVQASYPAQHYKGDAAAQTVTQGGEPAIKEVYPMRHSRGATIEPLRKIS